MPKFRGGQGSQEKLPGGPPYLGLYSIFNNMFMFTLPLPSSPPPLCASMICDFRSFKAIYSCLFSDSETTKAFGHRAAGVAAVVGQLPAVSPPAQRDGPAPTGLQHDHVKLLPAGGELLLPTLD